MEEILDEVFDALVAIDDLTYPTFRLVWQHKGLRLLHVLPFLDKKNVGKDFGHSGLSHLIMTSLFKTLCETIRTHTDVHTHIWTIYALYTLYETQVMSCCAIPERGASVVHGRCAFWC